MKNKIDLINKKNQLIIEYFQILNSILLKVHNQFCIYKYSATMTSTK